MSHHFIHLADNQNIAQAVCEELKGKGFQIEPHVISEGNAESNISKIELGDVESPVLLLVTDNFLKTANSMHGALSKIKSWADTGWLMPVIAPGSVQKEDGTTQPVPTNFERVSNIIPYMNFWQDKYLELRKQKRDDGNSSELDKHINQTKEISSDMGELLRFLRSLEHYSIDEFKANDYAVYRRALGEEVAPVSENESLQTEEELIEMIKGHKEDLIAENPVEVKTAPPAVSSTENGEELSEEFLASIPGMDLLDNTSIAPDESDDPLNDPNLDAEAASLMDELNRQQPSAPPIEEVDGLSEKIEEEEQDAPAGLLMSADADDLNSIVDEVLAEEGLGDVEDEDFEFLPEDSEDPNDFNLDALLDDDPPVSGLPAKNESVELSEDELAIDLLLEEDDEIVQIDGDKKISPEEVLEHALDMFAEGDTDQGLSFLEDALENNAGNTTLRYYYAYAQARYARNPDAAKNHLEILLRQNNSHTEAWYLMGELAENQEDYDGARRCFEKVVEINPNYPDIYYRLGLLTVQFFPHEAEKAAHYFIQAIEQDEENSDAIYALANLLQEQLGQPEEAIGQFENVLSIQPDHPFANYDLALLHHQLGNQKEAIEFYQKAIDIDPNLKTEQNDIAFGLVEEAVDAPVEINLVEEESPAVEKAVEVKKKPNEDAPIVLITGGTAGIGRATAKVFAREGYRVIITGRRSERLEEIKSEFTKEYDNDIQTLSFDVRDVEAVNNALEELPEAWQNVDILINNAGLSRGLAPIQEGKIEDWDTMIDTNVKGLLYLTRAIAPRMVARRSGHIINVASSAGKEVYPGGNVYCATKSAVEALTKSMRLDLYQHNVRVSQVSPGHVEETEFARVRFDWDEKKAEKTYENFQPLRSSDVAEAIFFMASRPAHVNIQDIFMYGTQQAGSNFIDRSGR